MRTCAVRNSHQHAVDKLSALLSRPHGLHLQARKEIVSPAIVNPEAVPGAPREGEHGSERTLGAYRPRDDGGVQPQRDEGGVYGGYEYIPPPPFLAHIGNFCSALKFALN